MKKILCAILAFCASAAFAATTVPVQLLSPMGSTAGQVITSSGPTSPPSFGALGYNALPVQIPNSLIGNVSSFTQAPNVVGLPSCASNTNALIYTNGAGFTCNTNINASTLGGQIFAAPGPIGSSVASTGAFTTLGASGLITPTSNIGIKGTATNDNAAAGSVGEYVSSQVLLASAVSLTTNVAANVTSISLTAGDWDVSGNVVFAGSGSSAITQELAWINTVSATLPTVPNSGAITYLTFAMGDGDNILQVGRIRISVAATTTVFLTAQAAITASTLKAYGFIGARRVR